MRVRVMEVGLTVLGGHLGATYSYKTGGEAVLRKAQAQMALEDKNKDLDWVKDEPFLSEAITMHFAVKTAWRNPTMHLEKTYTGEVAEEIWDATRGFMRRLAGGLSE